MSLHPPFWGLNPGFLGYNGLWEEISENKARYKADYTYHSDCLSDDYRVPGF